MEQGRLTLPIETGMDNEVKTLIARLGADAVRNSDGTELPEIVSELATKVYSTYFPARGDQAWALQNPDAYIHQFLMSGPRTALSEAPLDINPIRGYFELQLTPELDCDTAKYWQVIDRTTGQALAPNQWEIIFDGFSLDAAEEAAYPAPPYLGGEVSAPQASPDLRVRIKTPQAGHVYTVNFLARQLWDSTQMYNYLTNDWYLEPKRVRELPYDVRLDHVWEHVRGALDDWLGQHPEVDVVRFTTFFYHFTIAYDYAAREKWVDWFGYSCSVSVPSLEAFAAEYGYELTPEDFVDGGYYNNAFRPPSKAFMDWIDFTSRFVAERSRELVEKVHAAGKEAMMFLGDNWIGTEPYGKYFPSIGLDAVVGSVGSSATCRMISDIPGVQYSEGRLLPYFFPDVFREGGDPVGEARNNWVAARRAIMRKPLDRIGFGGYLSLANKFPEFISEVESITAEFRQIHEHLQGARVATAPFKVGILNAWGALRSWQTHMVSHAQWYRQTYSYLGVLDALAGLPFDVKFYSFDDLISGSIDPQVEVLINVGALGTAFSGGQRWADPDLQVAARQWVSQGKGLIGVGQPTATPISEDRASFASGRLFQLADVFGVDQEAGVSLSGRHYYTPVAPTDHFIGKDLRGLFAVGEGVDSVVAIRESVQVLQLTGGYIDLACATFGQGRSVYLSGLPFDVTNTRLLARALYWAAGREADWGSAENPDLVSSNPAVEVAHIVENDGTTRGYWLINGTETQQEGQVLGVVGSGYTVPARAAVWVPALSSE